MLGCIYFGGNETYPVLQLSENPKQALSEDSVTKRSNSHEKRATDPTYAEFRKMNVFDRSKSHASMSLMFESAYLSIVSKFSDESRRYFSSSVIYITTGHLNAFCRYAQKLNGIIWPRCSALEDGPLPVYMYTGFPASYASRNLSKSRCVKYSPRRIKV